MTRQSAVGWAASKHSLIPSKNLEITKLEIALKVRTKLALFLRLNVWQENTLGLFQHIQGHLSIEPPYDPMGLQHEIRSMFEVNQWSKLMGILWESCGAQLNRPMWNPWPKSIAPLSKGRWSRNLGALRHQGATALTASTQARQGNLIIKIFMAMIYLETEPVFDWLMVLETAFPSPVQADSECFQAEIKQP